jgi:hypothetical protein
MFDQLIGLQNEYEDFFQTILEEEEAESAAGGMPPEKKAKHNMCQSLIACDDVNPNCPKIQLTNDQLNLVTFIHENITPNFDKNARMQILFLYGVAGTGKTTFINYIVNRFLGGGDRRFMTIKNILLNEFMKNTCMVHVEYNVGVSTRTHYNIDDCQSKCYCSTIAKIMYDLVISQKLFNDKDISISDLYENCKHIIESLTKKRRQHERISLWIIDEYTMVSPSCFYILLMLAQAVNNKVLVLVCGDQNQCGPIGFSSNYYNEDCKPQPVVDPRSKEFMSKPIATDLKLIANHIVSSENIFEYTLKTLVRAAEDSNLKQFLLDFDELNKLQSPETDKLKTIQTFVLKHEFDFNGCINLDSYINDYEMFIKKREKGNLNIEPPRLFKILVKTNKECYDLVESFVKNVYSVLSERFAPSVLKKYIASYQSGSIKEYGYLMVGCNYKLLSNISKPQFVNSTMMTLKSIEWRDSECISAVIMETIESKEMARFTPTNHNFDRRVENKHLGFPFHMIIVENAFQSQGLTILDEGYLNMRSCNSREQYVMLSRFKRISQIKSIINCC